jgi:hypothetical protein
MRIPEFAAEASLGPSKNHYRGRAIHSRGGGATVARSGAMRAQQSLPPGLGSILSPDCFGSFDDCLARFCNHLEGKAHAVCFAACQKPSVCGGCVCSCGPDCVQTCQNTCTKSTPSDTLTCTGSCPGLSNVFSHVLTQV